MKKATIVKGVALIGALGVAAIFAKRVLTARATRAKHEVPVVAPVAIRVAPVAKRDMVERARATGIIRPRAEVDVFTKLPGRLERVLVRVGDKVRAGQLLAMVEHREVLWQNKQALAQAQAAEAAGEVQGTTLENAGLQYDRFKRLRKDKAVPEADFERVESGFRAAKAGVRAAGAQIALAQASAGLAGEALRNARITSPIAGTVTRRNVEAGSFASPMQPLFQIQDVATVKAEAAFPPRDFSRLTKGQEARVVADDVGGAVFAGKITTLGPTLDPMTRRAPVEVTLGNRDGRLLPNMFVQVELDLGVRRGLVGIPVAAIVSLPSGRVVYVVRNAKAVAVRARFGIADGEFVAVESGLIEGDQLVVEGQGSLADGTPVAVVADKSTRK